MFEHAVHIGIGQHRTPSFLPAPALSAASSARRVQGVGSRVIAHFCATEPGPGRMPPPPDSVEVWDAQRVCSYEYIAVGEAREWIWEGPPTETAPEPSAVDSTTPSSSRHTHWAAVLVLALRLYSTSHKHISVFVCFLLRHQVRRLRQQGL